MKRITDFCVILALGVLPTVAVAQREKLSDEEFVKAKPAIGDPLPGVTVYDPSGKEVKTASLRGHYTVLTFGCLT